MSDKAIPSLQDGDPLADGDELYAVRSGNSRRVSWPTISTLLPNNAVEFLLRHPTNGNYFRSANLSYDPTTSPIPTVWFGVNAGGPVSLLVQRNPENFKGFNYRGADGIRKITVGGWEVSKIGGPASYYFGRSDTTGGELGPPATLNVGNVGFLAGLTYVTGWGFSSVNGFSYTAAMYYTCIGGNSATSRPGSMTTRVTPVGGTVGQGSFFWMSNAAGGLFANITSESNPGTPAVPKIAMQGGLFAAKDTGLYWLTFALDGAPLVNGETGLGITARGARKMWVSRVLTALDTTLSIAYKDAGGAEEFARVSLAAVDSGGAGFRALRVPNG